jgi:hypothetical protein
MPATVQFNVAMSPAEAFDYSLQALQASGVPIITQTPPVHLEFSVTRRDAETGTLDAIMPGRALVAATAEGHSTVTFVIDAATQFVVYAVGLGLAALLVGSLLFGNFGGLWFLAVLAGEAYLFWAIYVKWPTDALNMIRTKMQASSAVSAGSKVVEQVAIKFGTPPSQQAAGGDIADQIRKLAELRSQGYLTQEEFDAKKAELLKRM